MPGLRPTFFSYGEQEHGSHYYSFMVLEQLGPSLADLLKACGGTFTIATTLKLAIQLVSTAVLAIDAFGQARQSALVCMYTASQWHRADLWHF